LILRVKTAKQSMDPSHIDVKVKITLDLEKYFSTASVDVEEHDAIVTDESGEIVTTIFACACDEISFTCDSTLAETKLYSQNDLLNVCVSDATGYSAG